MAVRTKAERLQEFYRRLGAAAPCSTHDDAFEEIARTLNGVEDEYTDIPYSAQHADPRLRLASDGRMYPPHPALRVKTPLVEMSLIVVYRTAGHHVLIGKNGSIEFRKRERVPSPQGAPPTPSSYGELESARPGADGRHVWEQK